MGFVDDILLTSQTLPRNEKRLDDVVRVAKPPALQHNKDIEPP